MVLPLPLEESVPNEEVLPPHRGTPPSLMKPAMIMRMSQTRCRMCLKCRGENSMKMKRKKRAERLVIPMPAPRTKSNESASTPSNTPGGGNSSAPLAEEEGAPSMVPSQGESAASGAAATGGTSSTASQENGHSKTLRLQKDHIWSSENGAQRNLDRQAAEELLRELSEEGNTSRQPSSQAKKTIESTTKHSQNQSGSEATQTYIDWSSVTHQQDFLKGDETLKKKLFAQQKRQLKGAQGPMLLQNRDSPAADPNSETSVREQLAYRSDLDTLPNDMEASAEAYANVPIDEFGDAMLRGMGATEEQLRKEDAEQFVGAKRPARLGLGSEVNPLKLEEEEQRAKNRKYVKPGDNRQSESINKVFAESQKGDKKSSSTSTRYSGKNSTYQVGTVVRIIHGRWNEQIALITKAQGVPGLNKIEVRLIKDESARLAEAKAKARKEGKDSTAVSIPSVDDDIGSLNLEDTEIRRISKDQCVLWERKEGSDNESSEAVIQALKGAEEEHRRNEREEERLRQRLQEERAKQSADKDNEQLRQLKSEASNENARNSQEQSRGKRSRSYDKVGESKSKTRKTDSSTAKPVAPKENWLWTGIRVRVTKKSFKDGKYYLCKGLVTHIEAPGIATIKMDCTESEQIGGGVELQKVSQKWLETVVPRKKDESSRSSGRSSRLMVVRGESAGQRGILLERNKKDQKVVARLEDDEVLTLPFDYVAETATFRNSQHR
eukprot:gb/GECG01006167.1/.p1 GENE.gb/GECG01006167.1/~~gb/GECG01006167.1/.p1  ORF type:complete len:722 (+),score=136.54 gb/GECG01006167.1/:1-2166(+)